MVISAFPGSLVSPELGHVRWGVGGEGGVHLPLLPGQLRQRRDPVRSFSPLPRAAERDSNCDWPAHSHGGGALSEGWGGTDWALYMCDFLFQL